MSETCWEQGRPTDLDHSLQKCYEREISFYLFGITVFWDLLANSSSALLQGIPSRMPLLKKITKIFFKAKIETICGQSTSLFSAITICN